MRNTLIFENEYETNRPLRVDRYPDGYFCFLIGTEQITAHPVSLSPSQIGELVAFLKGRDGK